MDAITVQCVYGSKHLRHIEECLIPALARSTQRQIRLLTINYDPLSLQNVASGHRHGLDVLDIKNKALVATGFAENHNTLFKIGNVDNHFVILNPDCIPHNNCIERLIERKLITPGAGIVEGRQWPHEHPKEYDILSLQTPWASGAFALIDADFYRSVGGMDENYFMYIEDVDLSWQAWLNGYSVLYEPAATIAHFSGGPFYREAIISDEQYLGLRNFIILLRKFFGESGEHKALSMLAEHPDRELCNIAIQDYYNNFYDKIISIPNAAQHKQIKVLGLGLFHRLRDV